MKITVFSIGIAVCPVGGSARPMTLDDVTSLV
jgi:hypothetical protein